MKKGHVGSKLMSLNKLINYKNILNCTKVADVESMEKYLKIIRCTWRKSETKPFIKVQRRID